ncbi:zinc protease [Megavirus baoshan]|uniref:Zinc protease n=1 Tax=Megavirus baoshan TaxID=2496520 RepID=A0A3Q8U8H5_9VIRU|nr:zinc protease [Megavirus baoshan]AZL89516.1 zinc protease [Megavirus baoshan]
MKYYQKKLHNGINLLLVPDYRLPIITIGFFVRVGSRNETMEHNGIAHLLEHMLFKSTINRNTNILFKQLDTIGATYNAATTAEQTYCYLSGSSDNTMFLLDILLDIYLNPKLSNSDIIMEKKVIIEEMRMRSDSPLTKLYSQLHRQIYCNTSLERDIIGNINTISKINSKNLREFHQKFYQPKNTVFVIIGNFNPILIYKNIKPILSSMINNNFNSRYLDNYYDEKKIIISNIKKQFEPKIFVKQQPELNQIYLLMAFPILEINDQELIIIDLITQLLSGGFSSKLSKALREDNGISYTSISYPVLYQDSGIFIIQLIINPEKLYNAINIIGNVLSEIKKNLITSQELEKIINTHKNELIFSMTNPLKILTYIGINILSNENFKINLKHNFAKIKKIKPLELRNFCRKIFVPEKLNLMIYAGTNYDIKINNNLFKF